MIHPFLRYLCLCGLLSVVAMGCSSSSDDDGQTAADTGRSLPKPVLLTIRPADDAAATRTTLSESTDGFEALWTAGDKLQYCNLSQIDIPETGNVPQGQLTALSSAVRSEFAGEVTCNEGDQLAVVYPASSFAYQAESHAVYTLALSGQDGTLDTLAAKFHCVYGVARVTKVNGTTATATMAKMKSLLTMCKFTFTSDSTPVSVKELQIGLVGDGDGGRENTYPQAVTVVASAVQDAVSAVPVAGSAPLTVTLPSVQTAVYVVMVPVKNRSLRFTVSDGTSSYVGTVTATLTAGDYVEANLKLTKQI